MGLINKIFRMSRFDRSSDIVRMKAIIITGFACLLVLTGTAAVTWLLFDIWSVFGAMLLAAFVFSFVLTISLRYHKQYNLIAIGFTMLICGAVLGVALPDRSGLDSSFTPFLPLSIVATGLIASWRITILSCIFSLCVIAILWIQSVSSGSALVAAKYTDPIIINQTIQLCLACLMAALISVTISVSVHGLFQRDSGNVDKIQQVERQRTAFLSSLSHEIRTPLNGIVGMSKLLVKTEMTGQQRQYADIVAKCSEDLMEVMSTVMEFSQINNQRIALNAGRFDIHKLAHDLVQRQAARIDNKPDVILGLHIAPHVPQFLFADCKRIEIVINHLLQNAVHFTPAGSVNLLLDGQKIDEEEFRLSVYVRDTGVGIRHEDLDHIYKPFHQLDNRLTREHEGTGLGLSLCKEIIEFMKGRLDVVSEFGKGSTFFFELVVPLRDRRKSDAPETNQQIAKADDLSNIAIFRKTG